MERAYLNPPEIAEHIIEIGQKKTHTSTLRLLMLGILAGAFIAFAAEGSSCAVHTIESVGIAKTVAGALFATGLILVLIAGGELFTGNSLIIISCLEKKSKWLGLLRNWASVFTGNFIGSMIIVLLIVYSGQLDFSHGLLGGYTIKVAANKTALSFTAALSMGILCNWLVCLAVWMSFAAKELAGKILAIFFPIWLFITSGFEHSIANMFYIPAGILAKSNPAWVQSAQSLGVTSAAIDGLNWGSFLIKNLLPVTLGNIIGGAVFVGAAYWVCYLKKSRTGNDSGISPHKINGC